MTLNRSQGHSVPRLRVCAIALAALFSLGMELGLAQAQAATTQPNMQAQAQLPTPPQPAAGTLDRVRASGKIVLGYRSDDAPMSYHNGSGQPTGYTVTLCQHIADDLKTQLQLPTIAVEWVAVSAETGRQDVRQGRIDLLCAADAVTLANRQQVSYSTPIFAGGMAALVRSNAPTEFQHALESRPPPYKPIWRGTPPAVLQHKTVAVVAGTPAVGMVAERIAALKIIATISTEPTYAAATADVASGKSDVLFGERQHLLAQVAQSPAAKNLKVLSRHYTHEALALALPRNDDDFRLAVDRAVANFLASPKFGELYIATFGQADVDTVEFFRATPR